MIFLVYTGSVLILFKGIKFFEVTVREAYYTFVTKRLVADVSHVPVRNCILGIYKPELPYSFDLLRRIESGLGAGFSIISIYQAWGDKEENTFPASAMEKIVENGAVPMLTWEPWINEFNAGNLRPMPMREQRYLRDIANGLYDFYISQWAKAAVVWGKPVFLRFAHEMTNPQYPWSPQNGNRPDDYIYAWRHVHGVFDSLGASNVIWVWCPYSPGTLNYYPGHEYVDWVAMDIFNYGDLLSSDEQRWLSFDQLASPIYNDLSTLRKPVMVAEVGCGDIGGSRAVWYREMLQQITNKFVNIKAVVFFDNPADRTSGKWVLDWSLESSDEVMGEVRNTFAEGYFRYVENYSRKLSKK